MTQGNDPHLLLLAAAGYRLAAQDQSRAPNLREMTFRVAQSAQNSVAAAALSRMAVRTAKGDSELARLVRERQDLIGESQIRNTRLVADLSKPAGARDQAAEREHRQRLSEIDNRIDAIDEALKKRFPEYIALVAPEPPTIREIQAVLRTGEVLIVFLDTPAWQSLSEESFVWAIPDKGEPRWIRMELGTSALADRVAALRCGLDADAWIGNRCSDLLHLAFTPADRKAGKPLPFNLDRAHDLYRALFGQIEDMIKDKHLLVVPSGPLTTLPFQVLITEPATNTTSFSNAPWLGTRQPITVLPSVASLQALRKFAKTSQASRPFIGFGNPLLQGNPAIAWHAALARQAREKKRCPDIEVGRLPVLRETFDALKPLARNGLAEVATIRALVPLPESADELCAVARNLGLPGTEIRLGANATEREVKAMSKDGRLASHRIVHFATHGVVSGEISGNAEPGLILTPPDTATELDDGYLTASEIAQLRLDADWIILSACNTAAGGRTGAEPLSGLARAFFYAGGRSLLVSHWSVDSAVTVELITKAFLEIRQNPKIGRAEGIRRAMLALIQSSEPLAAHPRYWAPFIVVGEGAR